MEPYYEKGLKPSDSEGEKISSYLVSWFPEDAHNYWLFTQGQAEWVTHRGPSLVSAASGQPPLWSQGGCGGELTGPGLSVSQPIWTGCPA